MSLVIDASVLVDIFAPKEEGKKKFAISRSPPALKAYSTDKHFPTATVNVPAGPALILKTRPAMEGTRP